MSDVLSVTQLVSQVKQLLESRFYSISLEGEISNLSLSSTGHWYFTLSDEKSSVSIALFRGDALRSPLIRNLQDGDKVIVAGAISVYQKRGTFQVVAKKLFPAGKGDLQLRFEQLKQKLASQGLFDMEVKKEIPRFAQKVAVITAEHSAALQDFINIYSRRSFIKNITLIPATVQGEGAPESLRKALFKVQKYNQMEKDQHKHFDLIVLTRGGGSLEDLWSFNDEGLAYDIFNCEIPIISAVGHQVDFSISDLVADMRCETPSAAAEVITQYQMELRQRLDHCLTLQKNIARQMIKPYLQRLTQNDPKLVLADIQNKINRLNNKMARINLISRTEELIRWREKMINLEELAEDLVSYLKELFKSYHHRLDKLETGLLALGPKNVLKRGYTYINTEDDKIVGSYANFKTIENGQKLNISFHDGVGRVVKE